MLAYAGAIFLSAFLLFQVQPLAGKVLLPWYGGSAAVWSTCLLFFQAVLFLGYLYAHLLGGRLAPRRQAAVHLLLLGASLALLPVAAPGAWRPVDEARPLARILAFLAATLGLPYFLLSATSPLLQRWHSLRSPTAPWRFYALSNLGSLLGLLSYPLLVEPRLGLPAQRTAWSALYALFALAVGACAAGLARGASAPAAGAPAAPAASEGRAPTPAALVAALALTGSLLMAATTHHLCENVAVVPLLWILPLALYLASFIVVFAGDRFYRRGPMLALLVATTAAAVAGLFLGPRLELLPRVAILCAQLLTGCIVLHGEIARLRPDPAGLTRYYLLLSGGGALGTAFVAFVAPAIFAGFWEYHVALAACWGLALVASARSAGRAPGRPRRLALGAGALGLLALVVALRWHTLVAMAQTVRAERNFYGTLQVVEHDPGEPLRHRFELTNGGIVHGIQFTAPALRRLPTGYYEPHSGLAMALRAARAARRAAGAPETLDIACIGLGAGAIAAYTLPGDRLRYYEINPAVTRAARADFTFLADAAGAVEVVPGDARLSLEREAALPGAARHDVLIVDAFTGDAIPVHLLTRECLRLYLARLAPGGRLLLHVSNRYLDLRPLVLGLAADAGRAALLIDTRPAHPGDLGATWADLAPAPADYSPEERAAAAASRPAAQAPAVVWTDEYSHLLGLLERSPRR
jgi:hypothetical protein